MESDNHTQTKGMVNGSSTFEQVDDINKMLQAFGDCEKFMPMTQALENKTFVVPPYVPKEKGYSQARFMGRLVGFNAAAWNDKRMPRMIKEKTGPNDNDIKIVLSAFTEEEENAVIKLTEKIKETDEPTNDSQKLFRLGLWEGTAILVHKEDLQLLYAEIDIDVNKGCSKNNIPSYEYSRLSEMSLCAFMNLGKSIDEIKIILEKEGADQSCAKNIIEGMLRNTLLLLQKPGLESIICLVIGFITIFAGIFIYEYFGRGSFIVFIGFGFLIGGVTPYIKYMRMKRKIEKALEENTCG